MFYSQFILAKKGPLGTIWIAAHLERKLRKNQVADTDIGVSVDSILFPDVPIALRLTSHLLLGVVRIYSRKVNYLFDDCSETLLKVKQAFRSAAVDLPPEESKAPYHSITLPETFELDDFELPDNDIFQGNFVDHHISSREQITLQDSMAGATYSPSKFGLDERFGDGDASGLDLDEELFLEKIGTAAGHASERSDPQSSVGPMTPLKQDEHPETRGDGVDNYADLMDYEHAPCTPTLLEEPNLSNVQEVSACDDHLESEYHLGESTVNENLKHNILEDKQEVDWSSCNNANTDAIPVVLTEECGHQSGGLHSNLSKPEGEYPLEPTIENVQVESLSGSKQLSDLLGQDKPLDPASEVTCTEDLQSVDANNDSNPSLLVDKPNDDHQGTSETGLEGSAFEISGLTSTCHQVSEGVLTDQGSLGVEVPGTGEIGSDRDKQFPVRSDSPLKNQDGFFSQDPEAHPRNQPADSSSFNLDIHENGAPSETFFLRPCNSNMEQPDVSCGVDMSTDAVAQFDVTGPTTSEREETVMIGKGFSGTHNSEENCKENHIQHSLQEEIHAPSSKPDNQVSDASTHDRLMENLNNSAEADLPAPEKLLSVPEDLVGQHNNMLPEATPGVFVGHDEGDAGSKIISGKKRSFTESTLTEQSLNSVESSRLVRFKSTIESVPADDDLLSSILVGRSSVFKVKPTPRRSEVSSTKRTRSTPRTGAPKRKLLMDDTMVLHGDMIRQQLTRTEDIRRARKKAPCTRAEISMIQQQQLEDGIFLQPLFIGMSVELISLHSQIRDLSGITVCKNDLAGASLEINADLRPPSDNAPFTNDNYVSFETMAEPMLSPHGVRTDGSLGSATSSRNIENVENLNMGNDKGSEEPNVAEQIEVNITEPLLLNRDCEPARSSEMNIKINDGEEQTKPTSGVGPMNDQNNDASSPASVVQTNPITETSERNTYVNDDTVAGLPDQEQNAPSIEFDFAVTDVHSGQAISRDEQAVKNGDIDALFETDREKNAPSIELDYAVTNVDNRQAISRDYIDAMFGTDQEKNAPSIELDYAVTDVDNGQAISRDDIDAMFETYHEKNASTIELDYGVTDVDNGQAICRDEMAAKDGGLDSMFKTDAVVRDDDPSEMARDGASFELLLNSKQGGLGYDERNEIHSAIFGENIEDSSYPAHGGMHENGFMDNGVSAEQPEAYQSYMMEADCSRFDLHDREDMDYAAAGNDTEFLNVDDDDLAEMDNEDIHDDEEARFAENSGWSSRTRAVSKYLQTLFNKEAECGRRSLSMDSLLVGKTRKEASRMFFEALVLKTRDYIHVEQPNPFDSVTIKPRTRLMKSDF